MEKFYILCVLVAVLLSACMPTSSKVITVDELYSNAEKYNGSVVNVEGNVSYSCGAISASVCCALTLEGDGDDFVYLYLGGSKIDGCGVIYTDIYDVILQSPFEVGKMYTFQGNVDSYHYELMNGAEVTKEGTQFNLYISNWSQS